jgi:hypothetical protein
MSLFFEDPLIEHWDGTAWTAFPHQNFCVQTTCGVLFGVAAVTATNVWVVGDITMGAGAPLIAHWDGMEWSVSFNPPLAARYLNSVSGTCMAASIAVGARDLNASTAIERYGPPQFPMKGPGRS